MFAGWRRTRSLRLRLLLLPARRDDFPIKPRDMDLRIVTH
jgi:hypothetical protein